MARIVTSSDRKASKKTGLHRREYVLATRILELGGAKRICAKSKLQVDFEGYASSDVDLMKASEVEAMLYANLHYAQYSTLIGTTCELEEKGLSGRMSPVVRARSGRAHAGPSTFNAFLAFTALVTSGVTALGVPLVYAAVTGIAGSLVLTGVTHRFLKRNRVSRRR